MNNTAQDRSKSQSLLTRAQLAKIHIAKKAVALDDDCYRDMLERVAGVRSARELQPEHLVELQREFRRLGWDGYLLRRSELPPLPYGDVDNRPDAPTGAQLRMLEAGFKNILGYADVAPDKAYRRFLKNRCGVEHPRFLDNAKYEAALSAVKRLQAERGVKDPRWALKDSKKW